MKSRSDIHGLGNQHFIFVEWVRRKYTVELACLAIGTINSLSSKNYHPWLCGLALQAWWHQVDAKKQRYRYYNREDACAISSRRRYNRSVSALVDRKKLTDGCETSRSLGPSYVFTEDDSIPNHHGHLALKNKQNIVNGILLGVGIAHNDRLFSSTCFLGKYPDRLQTKVYLSKPLVSGHHQP